MDPKELRVVMLTGAGVSADSGLATFRGHGGMWEGHRAEEVATPEAWARDPAMVWRFYQMRRASLGEVEPNDAHRAIASFGQRIRRAGGGFTLITQNVDDLHERGGSAEPIHMHGELAGLYCERCDHKIRNLEDLDSDRFLPCSACGFERMRPDIVWFGEVPYYLEEIDSALSSCTHFLAIGTSGVVYPAAGFLDMVRSRGASTWINSLEPPMNIHPGDTYVEGRASEKVPALLDELAGQWGC